MDPAALIGLIAVDLVASWARMLTALLISVAIGLCCGIAAATTELGERLLMPFVDILQTLPILAFFPFAIFVIVGLAPGWIGVNAAVVFLIVTSMLWNIIFGVYESVKSIPHEIIEVSRLYGMGRLRRILSVYVPASLPRVVDQAALSFAIGLFYLVTSEIFSTGSRSYAVQHGIGAEMVSLAAAGDLQSYAIGLLLFMAFVIGTRLVIFEPARRLVDRSGAAGAGEAWRGGTRRVLPYATGKLGIQARQRKPAARMRHAAYAVAVALAAAVPAVAQAAAGAPFLSTALGYERAIAVALLASLARVWLAFIAIVIVAVPVSVYIIFMSRRPGPYVTALQTMASIPATILLPLVAYAFRGSATGSELVALSVFFLSGVWYVVFSVASGSGRSDREFMEVKKVFQVTGTSAWRGIYLGAIMPDLITGGITAVAAEWNASIVAEYFTTAGPGGARVVTAVGTGMGRLLNTSLAAGNVGLMVLALLNLTALILLVNKFVWKRLYKRVLIPYR